MDKVKAVKEILVRASLVDGFAQYITPQTIENIATKISQLFPMKIKLSPNIYDEPMTKTEELWWDIIEAYKRQIKEALEKAGVEVE